METLGKKITTLRSKKFMSQEDLAKALNVTRQTISRWETDNIVPAPEKLHVLSELLGENLFEFMESIGQNPYEVRHPAQPVDDPVEADENSQEEAPKGTEADIQLKEVAVADYIKSRAENKIALTKKRTYLKLGAVLSGILTVIAFLVTFVWGFIAFSTNTGDQVYKTLSIEKWQFCFAVFATLLLVGVDVYLGVKIKKISNKLQNVT